MSFADEGGLIGKLNLGPFMVALEETHAKMLSVMPAPVLGDVVLVVPGLIVHTFGALAIPLNGRRVWVEESPHIDEAREWTILSNAHRAIAPLTGTYSLGVYLVREVDLEENERLQNEL